MKHLKLVAALLACAPMLSHADVVTYGSIRGGVTVLKDMASGQSIVGVDDYSSRIGFKGNEDLGNGLKAIWQVENGFAIDGMGKATGTSSGTFANRTSFIGLEGSFGKVRLGYLDDVMAETEATDIWLDSRRSGGLAFPYYEGNDLIGGFGDGRLKNSIRYDSPDLNGFSGILQYGADETSVGPKATQLGARLAYTNSGFFGGYAYQSKAHQGANAAKTATINRVEGGYDANNLYLAATYNWNKSYGDGTALGIASTTAELKSQSWALTASYDIGAFKPKFTYSRYKNPTVNGNTQDWGVRQLALGMDYAVSKKTTVGVQFAQVRENNGMQVVNRHASNTANEYGVFLKKNF